MNLFGTIGQTIIRQTHDKFSAAKRYIITGIACLVAGFFLGLALPHCSGQKAPKALSSIDSEIAKHEVKQTAPLKALDKQTLKKRGVIDGNTVASVQKEVLATATVKDDSGTLYAGAVLDTQSGETQIVGKRPFAEWMSRNEIGLGYGWSDEGDERAAVFEHTFARIWELYGSAEARLEQTGEDTRWSAMLWLKYRW